MAPPLQPGPDLPFYITYCLAQGTCRHCTRPTSTPVTLCAECSRCEEFCGHSPECSQHPLNQ